jgi:hypothetical protein
LFFQHEAFSNIFIIPTFRLQVLKISNYFNNNKINSLGFSEDSDKQQVIDINCFNGQSVWCQSKE